MALATSSISMISFLVYFLNRRRKKEKERATKQTSELIRSTHSNS
jgi:hypothetical protein